MTKELHNFELCLKTKSVSGDLAAAQNTGQEKSHYIDPRPISPFSLLPPPLKAFNAKLGIRRNDSNRSPPAAFKVLYSPFFLADIILSLWGEKKGKEGKRRDPVWIVCAGLTLLLDMEKRATAFLFHIYGRISRSRGFRIGEGKKWFPAD